MNHIVWMLMLFAPGEGTDAIENIPTKAECERLKERLAPQGMCVSVNRFIPRKPGTPPVLQAPRLRKTYSVS